MPKTRSEQSSKIEPLTGQRLVWLLGPALVAGVAYLDPGNVAANMSAGAKFGYLLVWVVVLANLIAWLIQYLSAKLGIVTGRSLPELLGEKIGSKWGRRAYWLQAELAAMATDLAEVIGGAVALNLLFGLPLIWGGVITGVVSLAVLSIQTRRGARAFETVVIALLLIIVIGFCAGIVVAPPDAGSMLGGMVPRFADTSSVLLATSILGATVMPHAIYVHSSLARDRFPLQANSDAGARTRRLLKATKWDVSVAMAVAGSTNLIMLLLAAASLSGVEGTDSLEGAYAALLTNLGPVIATLFAVGLLASGLASTSVGAYAGSEIMSGLLHIRVPMLIRRLVTLIPALLILLLGLDPTLALVLSQVVLSFAIPFALIPLVWLTSKSSVLGAHRNALATNIAGIASAVFLVSLNAVLIVLVATGN